MNDLTENAEKLLILIYKEYKFRIDSGESHGNAKYFGGLNQLHDKLHIKFNLEDTLELIRELSRAEYLKVSWADDRAYFIAITENVINYGEVYSANNVKE